MSTWLALAFGLGGGVVVIGVLLLNGLPLLLAALGLAGWGAGFYYGRKTWLDDPKPQRQSREPKK